MRSADATHLERLAPPDCAFSRSVSNAYPGLTCILYANLKTSSVLSRLVSQPDTVKLACFSLKKVMLCALLPPWCVQI